MLRKCGKSTRRGGDETTAGLAAGVGTELIVRFLKIEARDDTNRS
jgi:hypothetical protein